MAEVIRMPRMSDTMEEGVIVEWLKQEGEEVEPGDVLAEVETDKATMELESYHEGVLLHIGVKEGPVPVNGILAVIGAEGEDWQAALDAEQGAGDNGSSDAPAAPEPAAPVASNGAPAPASPAPVAEVAVATDTRTKASPLARRMAEDAGINIAQLQGSGDQGRIVKRDIEAAIQQQQAAPAPVAAPAPAAPQATEAAPAVRPFTFNGEAQFEDTPVSQMRKVIARRLSESKFGAPHFYLTVDIDMAKAMKWRKQLNAVAPVKISFNDLIVKAVAVSLRLHPAINSSWLEDRIRVNGNVNIGVAVAVPDGLLVPVVRHADMKSLSQINQEVKEMAGRAQSKKLQPEEMQGNTFTISNLGMFGIEEFTAIINPPDACIMAVGGIRTEPVVEDGNIVVGHRMKVTMSCDHRVVDGATGAKFLNSFKEMLEDPIRLLV